MIDWWKPKALNRHEKITSDGRFINELHFWDKLFGSYLDEENLRDIKSQKIIFSLQ